MEYNVKDLMCCDNMVECIQCKNCKKHFNDHDGLAVKLHREGKCVEILKG